MKCPTVAMWSRVQNAWYCIDHTDKYQWFKKDDEISARQVAALNILVYAKLLEKEIENMKKDLDKQPQTC